MHSWEIYAEDVTVDDYLRMPLRARESLEKALEHSRLTCDTRIDLEGVEELLGAPETSSFIYRSDKGSMALMQIKYRYDLEAVDLAIYSGPELTLQDFLKLFSHAHELLARCALRKGWRAYCFDVVSEKAVRYVEQLSGGVMTGQKIYDSYWVCYGEFTEEQLRQAIQDYGVPGWREDVKCHHCQDR